MRIANDNAVVGITDFVKATWNIMFLELPDIDDEVIAGEPFNIGLKLFQNFMPL